MQVCEQDEIIPVASARETEKQLGAYADASYYPIGHFDIYQGKHFERAVAEQVRFLQKHLATPGTGSNLLTLIETPDKFIGCHP